MEFGQSKARPVRLGAAALALLLQALVVAALAGAFSPLVLSKAAPDAMPSMAGMLTLTGPRPPEPPARPRITKAMRPAARTGMAGRRADPLAVAAPRTELALSAPLAPPVAAAGLDPRAGAGDSGIANGAAGIGDGTGAGGSGAAEGGGGSKPDKIAGDINSARDYPIASRDLRIGDYVIVVLTVGSDGRASSCRIQRPSRDAAADAVTCKLAMQRFRFRPGRDADSRPVESFYGWKQSWHY